MNPAPMSTSVGHSPPGGQITYAYDYNDRPCNFIDGALSESITISDNHPGDVIAKLVVLGRANGPLFQELGTFTELSRDVSIEALIQPPSGCDNSDVPAMLAARPTSDVEDFLCALETELTDAYAQVFKQTDRDTWNPKTGRYSRQVTWIYSDCAGSAPDTSFC